MIPILYYIPGSPAVRATLITIMYLNISVDYKLMKWYDDFEKPEFLELNPQHTVPTMVVENGSMWDSHAINIYLVSRYSENDYLDLYPKDIYQRAIVNQRLIFEAGPLFLGLKRIVKGYLMKEFEEEVPEHYVEDIMENYDFLEKFLKGKEWIAGKKLTLADFSMLPTLTTADIFVPVDPKVFPNITAWLKRVYKLPFCAKDKENLEAFKEFIGWK